MTPERLGWSKVEGRWANEASTVIGCNFDGGFTCPGCKHEIAPRLHPCQDPEGGVTAWYATCSLCGAELTLFND